MRRVALAVALLLITTACSAGSDETAGPVATGPATTAPPATTTTQTATAEPTTSLATPATAATTTAPTTATAAPPADGTTTIAPEGEPAFAMAQLVFGDGPYVAIRNVGTAPGSTDGLWLCQFPQYWPLPAVALGPGEVIAVGLGDIAVPDLIGVAHTADAAGAVGAITTQGGELGLYANRRFDDPLAIIDYVAWGNRFHPRAGVATEAGIWTERGSVAVDPETLGLLAGPLPTVGPSDWAAEVGG